MVIQTEKLLKNIIVKQAKIAHVPCEFLVFKRDQIPENINSKITEQYSEDFLGDAQYVLFCKGPIDKDMREKIFKCVDKALGGDKDKKKNANLLTVEDFKLLKMKGDEDDLPTSSEESSSEDPEDKEIDAQVNDIVDEPDEVSSDEASDEEEIDDAISNSDAIGDAIEKEPEDEIPDEDSSDDNDEDDAEEDSIEESLNEDSEGKNSRRSSKKNQLLAKYSDINKTLKRISMSLAKKMKNSDINVQAMVMYSVLRDFCSGSGASLTSRYEKRAKSAKSEALKSIYQTISEDIEDFGDGFEDLRTVYARIKKLQSVSESLNEDDEEIQTSPEEEQKPQVPTRYVFLKISLKK